MDWWKVVGYNQNHEKRCKYILASSKSEAIDLFLSSFPSFRRVDAYLNNYKKGAN